MYISYAIIIIIIIITEVLFSSSIMIGFNLKIQM
jgi:hypothetical protein